MKENTPCLFGISSDEKKAVIEITGICNMKCLHCMNDSSDSKVQTLNKETVFIILNELKANGFNRLYISGGEPLLFKEIDSVLEYAHNLGIKITLATNGWYVEKHIDVIEKCVEKVSISLDGIGKTHDYMRGIDNAFEKAIFALRLLSERGVYTKVSSMVWRESITQLEEIIKVAKDNGVKKVNFALLVPVGRAAKNKELLIQKDQYPQVYKEIEQLTEKYKDEVLVEIKRQRNVIEKGGVCPGGEKLIHIDAMGNMSPCSWIDKSNCPSFIKEWKPGALGICLANFKSFKKMLEERTEHYEQTGCAAMAFFHNGAYSAEDPIYGMLEKRG